MKPFQYIYIFEGDNSLCCLLLMMTGKMFSASNTGNLFRKFFVKNNHDESGSKYDSTPSDKNALSPSFNPPKFNFAKNFTAVKIDSAPHAKKELCDVVGGNDEISDNGKVEQIVNSRTIKDEIPLEVMEMGSDRTINHLYARIFEKQHDSLVNELHCLSMAIKRQASVTSETQHALDLALLSLDEKIGKFIEIGGSED
jgi:hypothetical protein